jgi:hypothetical protein
VQVRLLWIDSGKLPKSLKIINHNLCGLGYNSSRVVRGNVVTIAACYVSPEGIVLGADSTTTYGDPSGGQHFYNHSQKLFELGIELETGTYGAVTWGLGGLQVNSHRTLFALLSDDIVKSSPKSVVDVADRWTTRFWTAYSDPNCPVAPFITQCKSLHTKKAYDPSVAPGQGMRTEDEEKIYKQLHLGLVAGFCIGGYAPPDRTPAAYEIIFDPLQAKPTPVQITAGQWKFWGAPNMIQRLIFGADDELKENLMKSGKWNGTRPELDALVVQSALAHPIVPIRDAIDFVHAGIFSTIKAFKFSSLSQICGGPIELAVITTDRPFRWVRHKAWDVAITDGDP